MLKETTGNLDRLDRRKVLLMGEEEDPAPTAAAGMGTGVVAPLSHAESSYSLLSIESSQQSPSPVGPGTKALSFKDDLASADGQHSPLHLQPQHRGPFVIENPCCIAEINISNVEQLYTHLLHLTEQLDVTQRAVEALNGQRQVVEHSYRYECEAVATLGAELEQFKKECSEMKRKMHSQRLRSLAEVNECIEQQRSRIEVLKKDSAAAEEELGHLNADIVDCEQQLRLNSVGTVAEQQKKRRQEAEKFLGDKEFAYVLARHTVFANKTLIGALTKLPSDERADEFLCGHDDLPTADTRQLRSLLGNYLPPLHDSAVETANANTSIGMSHHEKASPSKKLELSRFSPTPERQQLSSLSSAGSMWSGSPTAGDPSGGDSVENLRHSLLLTNESHQQMRVAERGGGGNRSHSVDPKVQKKVAKMNAAAKDEIAQLKRRFGFQDKEPSLITALTMTPSSRASGSTAPRFVH